MQIIKILTGLVSFVFAGFSLLIICLIVLACLAQRSAGETMSPPANYSIMIGRWTLSGWQIYAVVSLFVVLAIAFILGGLCMFRSSKTATQ